MFDHKVILFIIQQLVRINELLFLFHVRLCEETKIAHKYG